jgi:putative serine protease PepD
VSALDRPIEAPNRFTIEGAIQTDAAINPGNSGGPLLDAQGRVIGINAQIRTDGDRQNSGVGFAIPIDTAKDVVPELKRNGEVRRPYLGVSTGDAPGDTGVLVASVAPGDPADDAGLREGDVIVRVGDKATNAPADVAAAIADRKVGEEVEVTYRRGEGDERTATVRLAERPQEVRTG